jgi:U3 small nucleolar RNA-associated protein 18
MNGSCQAVAFSKDEKIMYSAGDQAEIYQWDIGMRKCIGRVQDTGAFNTTSLALSPSGNLLATGSKMGSINFYSIDEGGISEAPFKSLMNLTTSITHLDFNHTGELLSFSSRWKKNAIKLAHIPSYTVFQNFPGVAPGVLKYPFSGGFSHKSQYYACGNDEGKCHLFELDHFKAKATK